MVVSNFGLSDQMLNSSNGFIVRFYELFLAAGKAGSRWKCAKLSQLWPRPHKSLLLLFNDYFSLIVSGLFPVSSYGHG